MAENMRYEAPGVYFSTISRDMPIGSFAASLVERIFQ